MIRTFSRLLTNNLAFSIYNSPKTFAPTVSRGSISPLWKPLAYHFSSLPKHQVLAMPALSPTMSEGKIVKWNKNVGDLVEEGDIICDVETDKATVGFEVTERGYLAQKRDTGDKPISVGTPLIVIVAKKELVKDFESFAFDASGKPAAAPQKAASKEQPKAAEPLKQAPKQEVRQQQPKQQQTSSQQGSRVFASPAAKSLASEKGIDLQAIGKGSGPDGRIIKQDVEGYRAPEPVQVAQATEAQPQKVAKAAKIEIPENPFQETAVNNMRKTIAARLTESKTTIPHYYISCSVEMDRVNALRNELNANEKENGVKISVNDIILKAMALALRDYPTVNSQWLGDRVRTFKYADVSVAVATEGGLITPIVYRADTLGLVAIAKRTKDIAKRAREGKLDPREYIGGTSTISNLGMFGVDSVTSVINPPQSTIVGVGKTEKKILFDAASTNPDKPYRVAQVCQLIVSSDHRVVDGAVAAQWVTRIKKYLEHPTQMLL